MDRSLPLARLTETEFFAWAEPRDRRCNPVEIGARLALAEVYRRPSGTQN